MSTNSKTIKNPMIGRVTRSTYWLVMVPFCIFLGLAESYGGEGGFALMILVSIPLLYVQVGRWHDLDYSGWLLLLNLVPIINFIAFLALGFLKGQEKSNRFGPSPYIENIR